MEKELNLFIIWNNGRYMEKNILEDIARKYEIIQTYNVNWSKDLFANNLARFYGKKLPKGCKKQQECGTGAFLLVTVYDPNPAYFNGLNANMINSKALYRSWTGGGHLIHACDNKEEAAENLLFLLGCTPEEFSRRHPGKWDGKTIDIHQDLIGAKDWEDEHKLQEFIAKLPETSIQNIADTKLITTQNIPLICRFLNATKKFIFTKRNLYQINIAGERRYIYIRNA